MGCTKLGELSLILRPSPHTISTALNPNNVDDIKRTEDPLYAVIEERGVNCPYGNGRLLLYKENESSIDGRELSDGRSYDREIDEGGDASGDEESKARSDEHKMDEGGDDSGDKEKIQG